MKFDNISEGQIIKNYKELCEILEIEPKSGGKSKSLQMRKIQMHVTFQRKGNKFIVMKIHEMDMLSPENRPYLESIEDLILDMLYFRDSYRQTLLLSKSKFLSELKMININYVTARSRKHRLGKELNASLTEINDFYDVSDKLLTRELEKSLKSLENKFAIMWNKTITVCEIESENEKGMDLMTRTLVLNAVRKEKQGVKNIKKFRKKYRKANEDELYKIIEAEDRIVREMGLKTKNDIYKSRRFEEFKEKVGDIAFLKTNILFYYESYEILPNKTAIDRIKEERVALKKTEREYREDVVNNEIMKRTIRNSNVRSKKAKEKHLFDQNYMDGIRASENYVEVMERLSTVLIDSKSENMSEKLSYYE